MKASDWTHVERRLRQRNELLGKITSLQMHQEHPDTGVIMFEARAGTTSYVTHTFADTRENVVARIGAMLLEELRLELADVERDLQVFGVEIDERDVAP